MMTRQDELRAMVAAATPGPWFEEVISGDDPIGDDWETDIEVTTADGRHIHSHDLGYHDHVDTQIKANAALIAQAPTLATDLATALDDMEKAWAEVARLREELVALGVKGMPAPPLLPPNRDEQIAQGKRCPCGGSNEMCVCQNVPDGKTLAARAALTPAKEG